MRIHFYKIKVCLPVLGAAKTESGYNTRCISFYFAMIGACTKWIALMNWLEKNFWLWGWKIIYFLLSFGGTYFQFQPWYLKFQLEKSSAKYLICMLKLIDYSDCHFDVSQSVLKFLNQLSFEINFHFIQHQQSVPIICLVNDLSPRCLPKFWERVNFYRFYAIFLWRLIYWFLSLDQV